MTEAVLAGSLMDLLTEPGMAGLGQYFHSLYVSDQNAEPANRHTPKMLCFTFRVATPRNLPSLL